MCRNSPERRVTPKSVRRSRYGYSSFVFKKSKVSLKSELISSPQ